MILSSECLSANITWIRPFIGMRPFVYEQIIRFCELSVAEFTNKLLLGTASSCHRSLKQPMVHLWGDHRPKICIRTGIVEISNIILVWVNRHGHIVCGAHGTRGKLSEVESIWYGGRSVQIHRWFLARARGVRQWWISWEGVVGKDGLESRGICNLHLMRVESASWGRSCHRHGVEVTRFKCIAGVAHHINYFFWIHFRILTVSWVGAARDNAILMIELAWNWMAMLLFCPSAFPHDFWLSSLCHLAAQNRVRSEMAEDNCVWVIISLEYWRS